eukprot:gene10571-biopygen15345
MRSPRTLKEGFWLGGDALQTPSLRCEVGNLAHTPALSRVLPLAVAHGHELAGIQRLRATRACHHAGARRMVVLFAAHPVPVRIAGGRIASSLPANESL